ncbi:hypothetical protein MTP99_004925 [Tenebrio molitor]|nr:hypothetical protein MTP99_004925 [Tenebrio molitor]
MLKMFENDDSVSLLMECCLGGSLSSALPKKGFDTAAVTFFTACMVEALVYLHSHNIVHRDLKPGNAVLDQQGYLKLCDFGCAQQLTANIKTWTMCGTPDYMAPEVIMNLGHDFSVDYWSLGIFIYECATGAPPYKSNDIMKIFKQAIAGIKTVQFQKSLTPTIVDLVTSLCASVPEKRLGYRSRGREIRHHKLFERFDWKGLAAGTVKPPFVPGVHFPVIRKIQEGVADFPTNFLM